jgi:hypothetical protein
MGINMYSLTPDCRAALLKQFPPRYANVVANHITQHFGAESGTPIPEAQDIRAIGIADDGNGLQALIVEVDGQRHRPDGNPFHITWSYEPTKIAPDAFNSPGKEHSILYRSFHSNNMVKLEQYSHYFETPVAIQATPEHREISEKAR